MKKRKARQGEKIYLLKATLSGRYGDVGEMPHRVLAIPEGSTLYSLAESIVESFDFDFDHAFGFYDNLKNSTNSKEGYELFADIGEESKLEGVERTKIKRVFDKLGKRMLFLFDYGDDWHFTVELERVQSSEEDVKYPLVVESVGDAPPQYGEPDEEDEL